MATRNKTGGEGAQAARGAVASALDGTSAPLAHDDGELDGITDAISKQLQTIDPKKPVVTLRTDSGEVAVHLERVKVLRTAMSGLRLRFKSSAGAELVVAVQVNGFIVREGPSRRPTSYVLRLAVPLLGQGKKSIYQKCVILQRAESDEEWNWLEEHGIRTTKPRKTESYPLFRQWWHATVNGAAPRFQAKGVGVTCSVEDGEVRFTSRDPAPSSEFRTSVAHHAARALVARAIDWVLLTLFRDLPLEVSAQHGSSGPLASAEDILKFLGLPTGAAYEKGTADQPFATSELEQWLAAPTGGKGLYLPKDVLRRICSSLNAERNLILMGPPGCGKTRLAVALAMFQSARAGSVGLEGAPKVVTASPEWTSGDVIGRYFPEAESGALRFRPGVFLEAIDEDRWLIIDEFNRANIDQCMGELFTVLSGQAVDLPFRAPSDDDDEDDASVEQTAVPDGVNTPPPDATKAAVLYPVQILPAADTGDGPLLRSRHRVPKSFRLIATMNDRDRSALNQLSFALLRRFDVISIEAPGRETLRTLLGDGLKDKAGEKHLAPLLEAVFISGSAALIPARVVGVALMRQTAALAHHLLVETASVDAVAANWATALALSSTVIPQLDALEPNDAKVALNTIRSQLSGSAERAEEWTGSRDATPRAYFTEQVKRFYRDGAIARIADEPVS